MNREVIVVAGPTAVGKTEYAIDIALRLNGEVVSCDSMQLYKYMDIGSAKPTREEQAKVKHYLVDEISPDEDFSVAKYKQLAKAAIEEIFQKGKVPIIAGGTGLYLNSLLYDMDFNEANRDEKLRERLYKEAEIYGKEYVYKKLVALDEEASKRIHPNNLVKVIRAIEIASSASKVKNFATDVKKTSDYNFRLIGLTRHRQELYNRINLRVDLLFQMGLVEEVSGLLNKGLSEENISMKGIGYKEVISYLNGEYDIACAKELVKRNTRHLAKRQLTWFKRYEDMEWFNLSLYNSKEECLEDIYKWLEKK